MFSRKLLASIFVAGTLAASAASAATIKTLHQFAGPGRDGTPAGGLATNGTGILYGVTSDGGNSVGAFCALTQGCGTIFSVDPSTGKFTTIHRFTDAEGTEPVGPLVPDGAGGFYGVTSGGGSFCGAGPQSIYRFDVAKRKVTVLYYIELGAPGVFTAAPVLVKGALYGKYSGSGVFGSAYRFDLATKTLNVIDSPTSGKRPAGGIITCSVSPGYHFDPSVAADKDGRIYGAAGDGRLFRIDPATNRIAGIHALTAKDGGGLSGPLTAAADGTLYGTTAVGGLCCNIAPGPCSSNCTEIFKFDPALSRFTVIHRFTNGDSISAPEGTTALSPNGKFLYGLTLSGGPQMLGALYRLDVETQKFSILHIFTGGADGAIGDFGTPGLKFSRGSLFGTTISGGKGYGTVFQVVP